MSRLFRVSLPYYPQYPPYYPVCLSRISTIFDRALPEYEASLTTALKCFLCIEPGLYQAFAAFLAFSTCFGHFSAVSSIICNNALPRIEIISAEYGPVLTVLCSCLSIIFPRISTISKPNMQRISANYPPVFPRNEPGLGATSPGMWSDFQRSLYSICAKCSATWSGLSASFTPILTGKWADIATIFGRICAVCVRSIRRNI